MADDVVKVAMLRFELRELETQLIEIRLIHWLRYSWERAAVYLIWMARGVSCAVVRRGRFGRPEAAKLRPMRLLARGQRAAWARRSGLAFLPVAAHAPAR